MLTRVSHVALVAAVSSVLAVVGFVVCGSLDAFEPCRVVYRTRQAVQGSLECQSYSAITIFSLLLTVAAAILAIVAVALAFMRRRADALPKALDGR